MKKSIKRYLAFIMAFAMMATYSFGPQNINVFAEDEEITAVAAEQQTTEAEKPAPSSYDSGETAASEAPTSAEDPTEATEPSDVETETTVESETETTTEEEDSYPAQSFSETVKDMTVKISAPEGALPEDSSVKVVAVRASKIESAVDDLIEDGQVVKAVDITFYDKEGKSIEPKKNVSVTFVSSAFKGLNDAQVVHIQDNGVAEAVSGSVSGSKAKFKSDEFSIYAVVDDVKIVIVNFYDGSGKFVTAEFIKKNGDEVEDLFEPSLELEEGEKFYGWASERTATEEEYESVDELNTYIENNWDSIGEELSFYAIVKKVYLVKFNRYDENGHLSILKTEKVAVDAADKTISIPGDLGSGAGSDFLGWIGQDGELYHEDDLFTVTDHFDFFMKETGRYWLLFDANKGGSGDSVTYTPPQLIYGEGVVTQKPNDPTRNGYQFLGWNTEADGSGTWWSKTDDLSVNKFGTAINEDITLYAQWEGVETDYYVLFWKQSADGKSYDYAGSEKRREKTGETVSTTQADRTMGGTVGSEYGYYFTYNSSKSDTEAVVAANGTTTLNVYYDRRVITYVFEGAGDYVSATYGKYGLVNGDYVQLYYRSGRWYYEVGDGDYHNTVYYRRGQGNNFIQYGGTRYNQGDATFTGLYKSEFTEWPDPGQGSVWGIGTGDNRVTFPLALTVFDPASYSGAASTAVTLTFTKSTHSANRELVAYVQDLNGSWIYDDEHAFVSG